MEQKIYFSQMFSEYEPPESLKDAIAQAVIVAADLDPVSRKISMVIHSETYISARLLDEISFDISSLYELRSLNLTPTYPAALLQSMDTEDLRDMFISENSTTRGSLAGATWNWEGTNLTISLLANGKKALEECVPRVQNRLAEQFGTAVNICIEAGNALEGKALFDAMEKMRGDLMAELPSQPQATKQEPVAPPSDAFYGKPFKGATTPMHQLNLDMGSVIVEGRVFAVDHKELKKRNAWVISFDMTDNSGSVRINRFMEAKEAKPILENVKEGSVLRVQGKLMINQFDNEMILKPFSMMPGSMPKRQDKAQGMKRVELHLHTNMSSMDALTQTADAVKQAAAWGHKAIAITDHGCCQSFTDALHAVETRKGPLKVAGTDEDFKVLYGCEGYYVNDVDDRIVVHGGRDISFDDAFVAFDLETTGLSSRTDTIIEIGAVLMKGGKEIDRFQTFVSPGRKLDPKIIELTGITDRMLNGAPSIEEVLPKFLEFVGDRVLVAHNSDFDTGFIRAACEKMDLPYDYTAADTLILARNLMPQLNKFKLDVVANALSLPDFNHHRAADDAAICGLIMSRFFGMLQERGINRLQEINGAMLKNEDKKLVLGPGNKHIIVLAKNQIGLRNLYQLISESNLDYYMRKFPRMLKSRLMALREGLIIGSACEAGELFDAVVEHKSEDELKRIASFYDYLEIQPIANNRFMLTPKNGKSARAANEEELRSFNRTIVRLGEELGIPVVATGDVHFLNPEDEIFRHILLATKGFDDCDRDNPLYLRTTDDMLEEFSYLGAEKAYEVVVTNTNLIADMVEKIRPVPYNLFAPKIENSVEDLKNLVYTKFHRLYGDNPPELMVKRVETELNDIISCHYDVIYMSAQKLVQNSLEHGYLVGSRGSVGSSIVAYMSGITEVNSFPPHYRCPNPDCKHTILDVPKEFNCGADLPDAMCPQCGTRMEKDGFNIPFETFLGFGGDKVPDIDLNFSGEYQANAHAYCVEMFGRSHVFRAGTIGTVAEKTAFGYVKKYLSERNKTASRAEENRLAAGCVGVRRTTGQHPGGLVVIPQENEIWDFCPVQHPADDPNSDQITTHFEYHSMEENLLKLDMLGHDDPTMIRYMEDITGVDAKTIPLDDPNTMSIFTSSKVLGYENDPILGPTGAVAVPEFNTRFTRGVLLDTMPKKFDFLVRISGYTHGTDVWLGNAKDLIVSGVARVDQTIGCRDDIMIYLINRGLPAARAFTIMEQVRKGKKLKPEDETEMREHDVPEWYIESCNKIQYMFPRAHAAAYVTMSLRVAYFKVYHPIAFYQSYYTVRADTFDYETMATGRKNALAKLRELQQMENPSARDKATMTILEVVNEMYARGIEFLPLDIYKSHPTKYLNIDGKILPALNSVAGLGDKVAQSIADAREDGRFFSIDDFKQRTSVSDTHIEMLKSFGCFKGIPQSAQVTMFD